MNVSKAFVTVGVSLHHYTVGGEHGCADHVIQLRRGGLVLHTWDPPTPEAARRQYSALETMLVLLEAIEYGKRGAH